MVPENILGALNDPADATVPRQQRLYRLLKEAVLNGTLAPGQALPASRLLAEEYAMARNSVLYAYQQLVAEGFLVADRRGTRVADLPVLPRAAPVAMSPEAAERQFLSQRAGSLQVRGGEPLLPFAPGVPDLNAFPWAVWSRHLQKAWGEVSARQLAYAEPGGEPLLGLGSGAYAALSALVLKRLSLRTDACSACKWHSLSPEIHLQAERANHFLSAWDRSGTVTCADEITSPVERSLWNAKNPPLSRRDLFRMLARQGQIAMARAMENGITSSKRQPGRERLRLVSAVSHLPESVANVDLHEFGFATLTISNSCNACGACGKSCPTEAVHFEMDANETAFSISFSAQNCIGCDICAHVCLPDAISINHTPTFKQVFGTKEPVRAASGSMVRCERCKTLMAAREGVTVCSLCEYRRTNPFGSKMPRKIVKESHS